jgi:antitoxin (DNA-binding transcriptional repressor) of toxin-antitoxin stability system
LIVNIQKAKKNISRLIKKALAGEEVIIARGSKHVARIVAIAEARKKRQPGSMKGKFSIGPEFFDPFTDDELSYWE